MTFKRTFRLALPVLALLLAGFAKQTPPITVRFYSEANSAETDNFETPVKLQFAARRAYVQKIPVISERDVAAIYPFAANDGTMGCAFKLDTGGAAKLDSVSVEMRGTSLVVVVNGRQVTDILIDRRVSDGIISIPSGLTALEIRDLTKKFPVLGAHRKKNAEDEAPGRPYFGD